MTPLKSGQSTSFITISGLTVFWSTSSNNDAGSFKFEIVGKIKTVNTFTSSVTF